MMLLILDRNAIISATKVPKKLRFKQLLELAQMISTITGSVYKPVKQGKEIMEWIKKNRDFTELYYSFLHSWCLNNINMKSKTIIDLYNIYSDFHKTCPNDFNTPKTVIFRYSKAYKDTKYATNSELPIDVAIEEYTKYLKWKGYEI